MGDWWWNSFLRGLIFSPCLSIYKDMRSSSHFNTFIIQSILTSLRRCRQEESRHPKEGQQSHTCYVTRLHLQMLWTYIKRNLVFLMHRVEEKGLQRKVIEWRRKIERKIEKNKERERGRIHTLEDVLREWIETDGRTNIQLDGHRYSMIFVVVVWCLHASRNARVLMCG